VVSGPAILLIPTAFETIVDQAGQKEGWPEFGEALALDVNSSYHLSVLVVQLRFERRVEILERAKVSQRLVQACPPVAGAQIATAVQDELKCLGDVVCAREVQIAGFALDADLHAPPGHVIGGVGRWGAALHDGWDAGIVAVKLGTVLAMQQVVHAQIQEALRRLPTQARVDDRVRLVECRNRVNHQV